MSKIYDQAAEDSLREVALAKRGYKILGGLYESTPAISEMYGMKPDPSPYAGSRAIDQTMGVVFGCPDPKKVREALVKLLALGYGGFEKPDDLECTCPYPAPEAADVHRGCPLHGDYAGALAEVDRLRWVMAAALERAQVDDCIEAELILSLEVNLDGSKVVRNA
jgi:hypothetical protein